LLKDLIIGSVDKVEILPKSLQI